MPKDGGRVVCPFVGCTAGAQGKPMERRWQDMSRLRAHMKDHLQEESSMDGWLLEHKTQLCPGLLCRRGAV